MNSFELEITLRCNASCPMCNRMCNVIDHGPSDMTLDQVSEFVASVRSAGGANIISVMGGEPTIHPEFKRIMALLHNELERTGLVRKLQVATNGIVPIPDLGFAVNAIRRPPEQKKHRSSFIAPVDRKQKAKHCTVPRKCGMAVNRFGYSPCGPASAIARLFGIDGFVRDTMPKNHREFVGYEMKICPLCQIHACQHIYGDPVPSRSYVGAFERYLASGGKPTKNILAHLAAAEKKKRSLS